MAKLLKIIKHPDPILRNISTKIDLKELGSEEFKKLLVDMEKTMYEEDGAGLAAPQIGKNIRLVILNDNQQTLFMINPQITKKSWAREVDMEGCLSVVDQQGELVYDQVSRHKKVNCIYYNERGEKKKIEAEGHLARAIQHEIDHLDGVLFIDRIEKNEEQN